MYSNIIFTAPWIKSSWLNQRFKHNDVLVVPSVNSRNWKNCFQYSTHLFQETIHQSYNSSRQAHLTKQLFASRITAMELRQRHELSHGICSCFSFLSQQCNCSL
uniref:Uncharacterized protein n=1 Tax=Arundo donax TaxID=35708 RepID=A0A0A9GS18_ARUDO